MAESMKIGFIGLDTSHVSAFVKLLNDPANEYHVPGGRVVAAFPGGSPDFDLSYSRVEGFTKELRDQFGVQIVDSPEAVAEVSDAVFIESVDGRVHLQQLSAIAGYGKPVFIDKPFAVSMKDAQAMAELSAQKGFPIMSCSSLRYAEGLTEALGSDEKGSIIGADLYGPMALQPTQPGFFWYGIHAVEMLFTIMGTGCSYVKTERQEDHDLVTAVWRDGRIGTVRGNRKGNNQFGGLIHREKGTQFVDVYANKKPYYASLLEQVMTMLQTGKPPIKLEETLEIVRFIEAANRSRETGEKVGL